MYASAAVHLDFSGLSRCQPRTWAHIMNQVPHIVCVCAYTHTHTHIYTSPRKIEKTQDNLLISLSPHANYTQANE